MELLLAPFLLLMPVNLGAVAKLSSRSIKCDESKTETVWIKPNYSTVMSFPVKPDNVLLGGKRLFAIEYIKNDLAISALSNSSETNLFVYMLGRRCGFKLKTSNKQSDEIIQVLDPDESKLKVKLHE
jgi:hypothetical protein